MKTAYRQLNRLILCFWLGMPLLAMAEGMDGLQSGQHAFNSGNYELSFALWQTEATNGNAEAQVFVGLSYANGWGVRKSPELARLWYRKAAKNGNPSGQFLLGLIYIQGTEAERSFGLHWLQQAAEGGDADAQRFLNKGESRGWFRGVTPYAEPVRQTQEQIQEKPAAEVASLAMANTTQ